MSTMSKTSLALDPLDELCTVFDAQSHKEAMINACEALFNKAKISSLPVNLQQILSALSARIVEHDIPNPGRLEIEDNGYAIHISKKTSESRSRFTIAHEIAHILIMEALLDKPDLLKMMRYTAYWSKLEKLCDFTASVILMPKDHFISKIKEFGLTTKGIDDLCTHYKVSKTAFFIRFIEVFHPSSIILYKSQSKGTSNICPSIYNYYNSIDSFSVQRGPIRMNDISINLLKACVKNGRSWNTSLITKIGNKTTRVLRLAILTSISFHNKNKISMKLDNYEYVEKDLHNYDIVFFYLPLQLISNLDDLNHALQVN